MFSTHVEEVYNLYKVMNYVEMRNFLGDDGTFIWKHLRHFWSRFEWIEWNSAYHMIKIKPIVTIISWRIGTLVGASQPRHSNETWPDVKSSPNKMAHMNTHMKWSKSISLILMIVRSDIMKSMNYLRMLIISIVMNKKMDIRLKLQF